MKILWLINLVLPKVSEKLGIPRIDAGSWIVGQLTQLENAEGVEMIVLSPSCVDELKCVTIDGVKYYVFDSRAADHSAAFKTVLETERPDVVHIYGTEYRHTLEMLKVCDTRRSVVSIQGLMSTCAENIMFGLPRRYERPSLPKRIVQAIRPYGGSIKSEQKSMYKASLLENEALRLTGSVIGRTDWDKACALRVNPTLRYFHCSEILRDSFYEGKWSPENMQRHMILISQASYPIKGLHLLLPQLPALRERYADLRVVIGGCNPLYYGARQRINDFRLEYQAYLKELIGKYSLQDCVQFIGSQSESEMKQLFLRANAFLCCSTIENESNSLSEARMLGVPSVCSFRGGMTERIRHGEDGFFYPLGEEYMIPEYISRIFDDDELCRVFSDRSSARAHEINDRKKNTSALMSIYRSIIAGAAGEANNAEENRR